MKMMCCNADPCLVAHWIYVSQTGCYARKRAHALRYLGRHFNCICNPEIMCAFIYGTNDADEHVRRRAIKEIIRQTKKHPCCCNCHVVAALTMALADCDKRVARLAEKGLNVCGYDVKCCAPSCVNSSCTSSCGPAACGATACGTTAPVATPAPVAAPTDVPEMPKESTEPAPAPAPAPEAAPAPEVKGTEPEAYFPSRLKNQQTRRPGLSTLFGVRG